MKNLITLIQAEELRNNEIEIIDLKGLFENLTDLASNELGDISSTLQSWFHNHITVNGNIISDEDQKALFFIGNLLRVLGENRTLVSESYGAIEKVQREFLD